MITCIIGFTGQGKSTLAYTVALRDSTRVIFDPRGQYHTTDMILENSQSLYEALDESPEIIVRPGRGTNVEANFDNVCSVIADWIEDNPDEPICILVDEGRLIGLDAKNVSLNFDWILRSAREGSAIDVVITCHRPVDLHTNIRAISNRLVLFRVMLPNDLEAIEEQCGQEVSASVQKLLDKQFVTWNNSRQQWRRIDNPQTWYVNLESIRNASRNTGSQSAA